jgi:hypothetical protein
MTNRNVLTVDLISIQVKAFQEVGLDRVNCEFSMNKTSINGSIPSGDNAHKIYIIEYSVEIP